MKKNLFIIFISLMYETLYCQNIIKNPSFEEYSFKQSVDIDLVDGWKKVSPKYVYLYNSPYNYFYINTSIKKIKIGHDSIQANYEIEPIDGNALIRSNRLTVRNLFQTKFTEQLEAGKTYYFEIWYNIRIKDSLRVSIKNIPKLRLGMHLTNINYSASENKELLYDDTLLDSYISKYKINLLPHLPIKERVFKIDKWCKYSITFVAHKNYSYGILGNFNTLPSGIFIDFYFDNLKLIPYEEAFNTENLNTGDKLKLENVPFEYNKAVLKEESKTTLLLLYDFLQKNKTIKIQIEGHTDNVGDKQKNLTLSENRAKAVMDYLTEEGISAERLTYKGYGSLLPIRDNRTEEGRAHNRRVEIKITEE